MGSSNVSLFSSGFAVTETFTNAIGTAQNITTGFLLSQAGTGVSGFYIIPLAAGNIECKLVGMEESETLLIPSAMVSANIGKPLPFKVEMIIPTTTTVNSALIVW